jgi:cupin fold WbuC family metalloprotein|tara:strand:+ start:2341 stop:2895 length:555 start_codon:yes stop_codon:yes gene_type:complete
MSYNYRDFIKVSNEVFVANNPLVTLDQKHIDFLKKQMDKSNRKRARICAHTSIGDSLHEMLIAISSKSYIHPHKHQQKVESYHVIEGDLDVVMFDDIGNILDVIELGCNSKSNSFFFRFTDSVFHTLHIKGDYAVLHEVTNGPFIPENTILAPFSPDESQRDEVLIYTENLTRRVKEFIVKRIK